MRRTLLAEHILNFSVRVRAEIGLWGPGPLLEQSPLLELLGVRDPFVQVFEQSEVFWKKKVYCSRHIFSDFSEHQNTESGVQEFSLKTVTLEILEQLSELVNFLELFKVWGGRVFVHHQGMGSENCSSFLVRSKVGRS